MPILNGLKASIQILQYLSKQDLDSYEIKLPYLCLITGADIKNVRDKMLQNGFDEIIQKPIFK